MLEYVQSIIIFAYIITNQIQQIMTKAEKLQEIKELENWVSKSGRDCLSIKKRIVWLKNNLETKPSKEELQMQSEHKASKRSKTLSFSI